MNPENNLCLDVQTVVILANQNKHKPKISIGGNPSTSHFLPSVESQGAVYLFILIQSHRNVYKIDVMKTVLPRDGDRENSLSL